MPVESSPDIVGPMAGVTARTRLLVAAAAGVAAGLVAVRAGAGIAAPLIGWDVVAVIFVGSVWLAVRPYDARTTRAHALRDNPTRGAADLVLLVAAVASLAAVTVVLVDARDAQGVVRQLELALGVASVVASWALVHTVYALEYARQYYEEPIGGVDFNQDAPPTYLDFAYLAFTIGMTYQVSDTSLSRTSIRRTALRQAFLSYLFGSVIIAVTINLIAGLTG